ncbi:PHP-associated domain-containing protein [Clostridium cylindrosporum]|uniref:Polymerase/histidinol phosphatase N-terminal domain-containing protein n=1 Tax=Clostridium cylindrosporum DSM 605 TaxID=1121307 RepID=A0A0J8G6C3_CLOCY|nr:PHP domain-containing protein [Clostridium cylindrosporum]KMT23156.1 hypothetical protein CLCY_6c00370 [Clostridium cylindrosporum DSM 605]
MIIDIHMHESKYSLDSFISLKEIVKKAKEIGLEGICITDHESNEIKEEARKLSIKESFPIIVGAEFLTFEGDILVFGLNNLPKEKIHAEELLEMVDKVGGAAIAAHPYRKNNRGLEGKIRTIKGLHGVECFNGSTPMDLNLIAYNDALQRGVALLGGSDSHVIENIGKYATRFPRGTCTVDDFITAIKNNQTEPVIYENGVYQDMKSYLERVI